MTSIGYSNARSDTIEALTKVLILHPIGSALLFLAFIFSLVSGSTILSVLAMLVAFAAFVVNAVALVIDFVTFTLLGKEIDDAPSADAAYGTAAWLSLVAGILALVATIILFITCCAGRRTKRRENRKSMEGGYVNNRHAY